MASTHHPNAIPDLLEEVPVPDRRWRAEYVEGGIAITPPADLEHLDIERDLLFQMHRGNVESARLRGLGYCHSARCTDEATGNHVVPDLAVLTRTYTPAEVSSAAGHLNWLPSDPLDLVAEVTGNDLIADMLVKVRAYGRMAIPYYLIVDRSVRTVTLLCTPTGDVDEPGYADKHEFRFGKDVDLPAPYPALTTKNWR
ncbi:Uma2 family endonuclease [Yinghuangia soli]|uniref:Uma2 family endonuclease n=1 Tax=Yinghuangia soli TaxID=2908204 RepID=A0AA41U1V8_9ACTN|nr:Uma2 family endonuclease [Yinghuangia soli]MCF2530071.1 Uma2 family endonuclease [Yinghuangia soli]